MYQPLQKKIEGVAKSQLLKRLQQLEHGYLSITDHDGTYLFGNKQDNLQVHLQIKQPAFYAALLLNGSFAVGKTFIDDWWQCDNLPGLIELYLQNQQQMSNLDSLLTSVMGGLFKPFYFLQRYNLKKSKQYIAAHYDLGNEFFKLFLDPTMMYSAGVFYPQTTCMQQASLDKLQRICEKLDLKPSDHVVEIGCGWGGFAVFAASHYQCQVTTTTISEQQYHYTQQRVAEMGLSDRVTVLQHDYRQLQGTFDKLVSIEMLEAVGYKQFGTFFSKVAALLKPNGAALIQTIVINDQSYEAAKRHIDYIKHYIFPGGCLPCLAEMARHIKQKSDLQIFHLESIGDDYVKTLQAWQKQFLVSSDKILAMGFEPAFIRKWLYYFAYCEAGFNTRYINDYQLILLKPQSRLPRILGQLT